MSDMTEPRGDKMDSYRLGLWLGALGRCKQVCEGAESPKIGLGVAQRAWWALGTGWCPMMRCQNNSGPRGWGHLASLTVSGPGVSHVPESELWVLGTSCPVSWPFRSQSQW